jgi:glutaredoxin-related protein
MDCPECSRITAEYQQLEQQYASAVNLLNAVGASEVREYIKLRAAANEARIDAENGAPRTVSAD